MNRFTLLEEVILEEKIALRIAASDAPITNEETEQLIQEAIKEAGNQTRLPQ